MKYLLFLILLINTSFINTTQKYWIGHCRIRMRPTFAWDDVTIIQAVSHDDADKKYKSYIKSYHDYKGGIIEEPNNPDKYLVYELTKDDILK